MNFSVFLFCQVYDAKPFLKSVIIGKCGAALTSFKISDADLAGVDKPAVSFVHTPGCVAVGDILYRIRDGKNVIVNAFIGVAPIFGLIAAGKD